MSIYSFVLIASLLSITACLNNNNKHGIVKIEHSADSLYVYEYYESNPFQRVVMKNKNGDTLSLFHVDSNNIIQGEAIRYDDKGNIRNRTFFINDLGHGNYKQYYPNGKIESLGTLLYGDLMGNIYFFNESGEMEVIQEYFHNTMISQTIFRAKDTFTLIYPIINVYPERPTYLDTMIVSFIFDMDVLAKYNEQLFVYLDAIDIEDGEVPVDLAHPRHSYKVENGCLTNRYLVEKCLNVLFYGYPYFVDTVKLDTIKHPVFEKVLKLCI